MRRASPESVEAEQPRAERRVADPAARIDARPDQKTEMIGPWRTIRAGDVEQSGEPRPRAPTHHREPFGDEGAVETGQRRDVGDRRERHEVEAGEKIGLGPRRKKNRGRAGCG